MYLIKPGTLKTIFISNHRHRTPFNQIRTFVSGPNQESVVKFRDLAQFVKTKSAVDEAHVRQLITVQRFKPLRFLGRGRFGKVYLCSKTVSEEKQFFAIKVLNVERDRREYNWTWLTAEERAQSQADAKRLRDFIQSLSPGLVKDHMTRAEEMLLDVMVKEENPQLRRVRRPVAEREILVRMGPHPLLCNMLTSFRDQRFMCLVFEYFPSGTLQNLLSKQMRFEEPVARFFGAQILLTLEFLQSKNVCHRVSQFFCS
jgi:serine/threonine protein kinase